MVEIEIEKESWGVICVLNDEKSAASKGKEARRKKSEKSTAPGIPRRSPIQVLTGPDVA